MRAFLLVSGFLVAGAVLAPAAPAAAQTANCDRASTAFDALYCERKVFEAADKDLNVAYGKLRSHLSSADRSTLRSSQLAWIRARDSRCTVEGDQAIRVNINCAKDATIARTNWLNDRVRECVSSSCRSSRLDE